MIRLTTAVTASDGNRTYFKADEDCPIHNELRQLLLKTVGLVDLLRDSLRQFGDRIATAFVYGSVAAGEAGSQSDIDLMVVGEIGLADLAGPLKEAERQLGRQINPVILSPAEVSRKLKDRNHFLNTVRKGRKLFLVGEDQGLGKAFKRYEGQAA